MHSPKMYVVIVVQNLWFERYLFKVNVGATGTPLIVQLKYAILFHYTSVKSRNAFVGEDDLSQVWIPSDSYIIGCQCNIVPVIRGVFEWLKISASRALDSEGWHDDLGCLMFSWAG